MGSQAHRGVGPMVFKATTLAASRGPRGVVTDHASVVADRHEYPRDRGVDADRVGKGPWWPHPIWGGDDQAGAWNWITPEKVLAAVQLVKTGQVYQLGQVSERGMPIFVFGMPRSGTTLVEQIISSHPLVFGAGELTRMPELTVALANVMHTKVVIHGVCRTSMKPRS